MALTRTNRDSIAGGSLANTITSHSFTPSNSSLLVVAVVGETDGGSQLRSSEMSISDSLGTLTWTKRVHGDTGGGGTYSPICAIWTAPVTTGASMTVSISNGGTGKSLHGGVIFVIYYTGYDTGTSTGATAANTMADDGAVSLTLSGTPASTSEVLGLLGHGVGGVGSITASPGSGWTEIYDLTYTDNTGGELQALVGLGSTTVPWADSDQGGDGCYDTNGVALEIKEAGGAAQDPDVPLLHNVQTLPNYRM